MELVSEGVYKTYLNHRAEPYFSFVKNGLKTIDGRVREGLYQKVKPGDHIIVCNQNDDTDRIEVLVRTLRIYSSIKEMLEKEDLKKVLPDVENVEEGILVYRRFYTSELEEKYGVVALEVERI